MSSLVFLDEEQLINQAVDALIDKLGLLETIRFLALKSESKRDSVKRHQEWQAQLDKDVFFAEVFNSSTSQKSSTFQESEALNDQKSPVKHRTLKKGPLRLVVSHKPKLKALKGSPRKRQYPVVSKA